MTDGTSTRRGADWAALPFGNSDFGLCESPMEEETLHCLSKYVGGEVKIVPQWEIQTLCGTFRADFPLASKSRRIIVECDGRKYHDRDRDEWRDAMILGTGDVDAIYRLQGRDIWYHRDDVFFIMGKWEPAMLQPSLAEKLSRVATERLVVSRCWEQGAIARHTYGDPAWNPDSPPSLWVERRSLITTPDIGKRQFWTSIFRFAQQCGGGPLNELMDRWWSSH